MNASDGVPSFGCQSFLLTADIYLYNWPCIAADLTIGKRYYFILPFPCRLVQSFTQQLLGKVCKTVW